MKDTKAKAKTPRIGFAEAAERDAAAVLARRAKKPIPQFDSEEELQLVPYLDVMVNLVIFMLVSVAYIMPLGILNIFPPAIKDPNAAGAKHDEKPKPALNLTVAITHKGFTFAGATGVMPNIPIKADGTYDYDNMQAQAVKIKDLFPDERLVIIVADPDIRYEVIVKTMDNLRTKGTRTLFDTVQLSAGIQ